IPQLYLATPDQILSCLRDATGEAVLVLGHNPGIGEFAQDILSKAPGHPGFDAYPTGATLIADWDVEDWTEAHWTNATARDFIVPRDLTAA
ncbi:MAG: histidine phosphatase family protein, partial [Pseudomonadota bacterium]